jgi:hypothetical protein
MHACMFLLQAPEYSYTTVVCVYVRPNYQVICFLHMLHDARARYHESSEQRFTHMHAVLPRSTLLV